MIVVSNTSPLNYLVLIECVDLLPRLFGRGVVPRTVADELAAPSAPEPVRAWISNPPDWLDIRVPKDMDPTIGLHPGERDALCLALELQADIVLVDDRAAREAARARGLVVTGTLGVLDLGARRGLVDLPGAIDVLRRTNYRIGEEVLERLLDEHARRPARPEDGRADAGSKA